MQCTEQFCGALHYVLAAWHTTLASAFCVSCNFRRFWREDEHRPRRFSRKVNYDKNTWQWRMKLNKYNNVWTTKDNTMLRATCGSYHGVCRPIILWTTGEFRYNLSKSDRVTNNWKQNYAAYTYTILAMQLPVAICHRRQYYSVILYYSRPI